jgi:hypothetical protein
VENCKLFLAFENTKRLWIHIKIRHYTWTNYDPTKGLQALQMVVIAIGGLQANVGIFQVYTRW